jgi:hypothetical protein
LIELCEVARRDERQMLKWLVDNADRALPWEALGEAIDCSFEVQCIDAVDLVKASTLLPLMDYPNCMSYAIAVGLLDAGLEHRAAGIVSALPDGLMFHWNWPKLAARALIVAEDELLSALLRRKPIRRAIQEEVVKWLDEAEEEDVADAFVNALEGRINRSKKWHPATIEGQQLVLKLRRCTGEEQGVPP